MAAVRAPPLTLKKALRVPLDRVLKLAAIVLQSGEFPASWDMSWPVQLVSLKTCSGQSVFRWTMS